MYKTLAVTTWLLVGLCGLATVLFWAVDPQRAHELLAIVLVVYLSFWIGLYLFTSFDWPAVALRFSLSTGGLLFSILAAEVVALSSLVDYRLVFQTVRDEPWRNPVNRSDPELLHIRKPYSHFKGYQKSGDIAQYHSVAHTNSYYYNARYDQHGFRNDTDLEQADLVVIGDSFIEAGQVSQQKTMTAVLGGLQGKVSANLGQSWYGPQQELVVLKRYAVPLKPEVVVWAFFGGNDLFDFHRYEEQIKDWPEISKQYHSFKKRSFTRNLLQVGLAHLASRELTPALECLLSKPSGETIPLYFHHSSDQLSFNGDTVEQVIQIFSEAKQVAQLNNIELVVAYVPSKIEVYHDICSFKNRPTYPAVGSKQLSDLLAERVSGMKNSISYIDLTPALREAAGKGEQVYFSDDTHWTPAGNRVAARAIHDFIGEKTHLSRH